MGMYNKDKLSRLEVGRTCSNARTYLKDHRSTCNNGQTWVKDHQAHPETKHHRYRICRHIHRLDHSCPGVYRQAVRRK